MALVALWIGLVALAGGCGIFKPDEGDPPDDGGVQPYPTLEKPEFVLSALQMAYERRDSVKYKELYDSSYVGTSIDQNDASTLIISYRDELDHIGALARAPGIRAKLDLGPAQTWVRQASDDLSHPEWTVIVISGASYSVRIDDSGNGNSYVAEGEFGTFQEFTFEPTLDESVDSDTLWAIVRWREVGKSAEVQNP